MKRKQKMLSVKTMLSRDDLMKCLMWVGHETAKESFELAKIACKTYQRMTVGMTKLQEYDFRRAFEIGYKAAMYQTGNAKAKS